VNLFPIGKAGENSEEHCPSEREEDPTTGCKEAKMRKKGWVLGVVLLAATLVVPPAFGAGK